VSRDRNRVRGVPDFCENLRLGLWPRAPRARSLLNLKPTAEGTQSATLSVVDGAGTQTSALSGSGTAVKLAPPSLTFTSTAVGTSSTPQTATVTNLGKTAITITSIAVGGTDPATLPKPTPAQQPRGELQLHHYCHLHSLAIGTLTANVTITIAMSLARRN